MTGPPHRMGLSRAYRDEITATVMTRLNSIPDVRKELVRTLHLAVSENRYSVPDEEVAESMIRCSFLNRLN